MKKEKNVVVLLTGCVNPPRNAIYTTISNKDVRYQMYYKAIDFYITNCKYKKIVFCDNSNFKDFPDLEDKAKDNGVELELLAFKGDSEMVVKKGKGYGDGEIIEYALTNSKLIGSCEYFIKISGRYIFDNINKLFNYNKNADVYYRVYLNKGNLFRKDENTLSDVVIYSAKKEVYKKYFSKIYLNVDDANGCYFEHLFTRKLLENKKKKYYKTCRFSQLPNYDNNVSGTKGTEYAKKGPLKKFVRKVLNVLNFYQV